MKCYRKYKDFRGSFSQIAYNLLPKTHLIKVIEIPSCELSRGRGGPHCMSMALEREDIK